MAKQLIEQQYMEQISLNDIADRVSNGEEVDTVIRTNPVWITKDNISGVG